LLGTRNETGLRLQIVLGGREILVDTLKVQLSSNIILHLLPYHLRTEANVRSNISWIDENQLLDIDQRKEWWQAWGKATRESLDGIPE
jgi:hypothetical protein